MDILNRGSDPTFVTSNRQEVIDITMISTFWIDYVKNWKVAKEDFLSDHRGITFQLEIEAPKPKSFRCPKSTNWSIFENELKSCVVETNLGTECLSHHEIDQRATTLHSAIWSSYEAACPLRTLKNRKSTLWWTNALEKLRKTSRKLFNRAQRTKDQSDWDNYSLARSVYKDEIRKAKRASWVEFCENINSVSESARIHKILSSNANLLPGSMEIEPGVYSESIKETTLHLFNVHFPGCNMLQEGNVGTTSSSNVIIEDSMDDSDWAFAASLINEKSIFWSLSSFTPYKSPGADGIFPALMQKAFPIIKQQLCTLFRSCIACGYIPKAWRFARVVFIPKPGRSSYDKAKSYRPICLSSFFLKTLERLMDWYIREKCLNMYPLHNNQHAYQRGKSVETALHNIVTVVEKSMDQKIYTLGTFLDIEGAFDKTTVQAIKHSLIAHGVPCTLVRFITFMLQHRLIIAECGSSTITASVNRGCPQGGVLSPLLWCLVLDSLIRELNQKNLYTLAYADDLAILIKGKFCDIISELTQQSLNIIEKWCANCELTVNPDKSECVLFSKKRTSPGLKDISIFGQVIRRAESVKYLGTILDSKLTWKQHFQMKTKKSIAIFWQCRRAIGRTWGLSPRSVLWIYTAIVRPMLVHAAIIWWHRVEVSSVQAQLNHIQRIACMGILGAFKTTPTAALEVLTGLPPLHIFVEMVARKTIIRLNIGDLWIQTGNTLYGHRKLWNKLAHESIYATMFKDCMAPYISTSANFNHKIDSREDWCSNTLTPSEGIVCFTDGSLMDERAGAGIFCRSPEIEESLPLGHLTSVFQAEVFAILHCSGLENIANLKGRNIHICSDSQAAIKAICSPAIKSPLVKQCRESLHNLSKQNNVTLLWVPGHSGVEGNEKADHLARLASARDFQGPEPSLGISFNTIRRTITEWCSLTHRKLWLKRQDCLQARKTLNTIDDNFSKSLLNIPRKVLRHVVAVITGHGPFNYHLSKMSLTNSPLCEFCVEGVNDTATHFLCDCPSFASLRVRCFGSHIIGTNEIKNNLTGLTDFIKRSGRFK